jgi:hypothetical protein
MKEERHASATLSLQKSGLSLLGFPRVHFSEGYAGRAIYTSGRSTLGSHCTRDTQDLSKNVTKSGTSRVVVTIPPNDPIRELGEPLRVMLIGSS